MLCAHHGLRQCFAIDPPTVTNLQGVRRWLGWVKLR